MLIDKNAPGSSARLAMFLSAAVCPGAGHFVQHRWIPGVLYLVAFIACLVMMFLAVVVPLIMNLRITMDFAEKGSSEVYRAISLFKVLAWFGLALLIYMGALLDISAYARRQARRRLDELQKETGPLEEKKPSA